MRARVAKGTGFSAAIQGANHHPDGALLAAILETIVARLDHPDAPPLALPDTVKMYGFG